MHYLKGICLYSEYDLRVNQKVVQHPSLKVSYSLAIAQKFLLNDATNTVAIGMICLHLEFSTWNFRQCSNEIHAILEN